MRPIPPRRVLSLLLVVTGLLALTSLAAQILRFQFGHDYVKGFVPMFLVDEEHNVPTWFATILLFVCSALLAVIATARHAAGDRFARHWTILAGGFLVMSIDEATRMHELLIRPLREALGLGGIFLYAWVIPGLVLVALLGIYYGRFMLELPARWRGLFIAAAGLYLGGALGLEMVEGAWTDAHTLDNMTYSMIALVEEAMEMLGASLFIYGLLTYIAAEWREVRLPLGARPEPARQRSG